MKKAAEYLEHEIVYSKLPFRKVAEEWLEEMDRKLAKTTYQKYESTLEIYIYPDFDDVAIADIGDERIDAFLKEASKKYENRGKYGEKLKSGTINLIRIVIKNVIDFAAQKDRKDGGGELLVDDRKEYSSLSEKELRQICSCAKYNHCPEMLAAMLMIFTGIRVGEVCAIGCDDIDLEAGKMNIHESVHRVKNRSGKGENKTVSVISEIPTKTQVRTEIIPDILINYVREFYNPGMCLLTGIKNQPMEAKTLRNRLDRIFDVYRIDRIAFQRFRKTFVEGKADVELLGEVFSGRMAMSAADGSVDTKWLRVEMANDLPSLRLLLGLSAEETSEIIGISKSVFKSIEEGKKELTWYQYLNLLFFFCYNPKTVPVVESLGLNPKILNELLSI